MDLNSISKSIFTKKTGGSISVVFFLLIFSIFIIFAIKPSLTTAFSLQKEELDLKKEDGVYEEAIFNITSIQTQIEQNRNDLPLLDQSLPKYPEVNKIINDIKTISDKNSLIINKASIVDINLSSSNQELQDVKLIMEVNASFDNLRLFITDLLNQRRLKVIDNIVISRNKDASGSGDLKAVLTIDGFFL